MKVLITGGGGFLGNQLARKILERGELIGPSGSPEAVDAMTLFDAHFSEASQQGLPDHVTLLSADIADRDAVFDAIDRDDISVFHLASMVSGECEIHFDDALRVNLDGGRNVFEACRALGGKPRVVFASSVASFGGAVMPEVVSDATKRTPQTTYGMTKVIGEMMINDYSRKGFLDGRSVRLPTVIIRPGRPNTAASSWASGMFREPLRGEACELPVRRDQGHPVIGYRDVIDSFIALHEAPAENLGDDRAFGLPSHRVTPETARVALEELAVERGIALGPLIESYDARIQGIVDTWPTATDGSRAISVGCPEPKPLKTMIEEYLEDFG